MISDFGLSKMEGKGDVMSTACGTPGYVGKGSACACARMCVPMMLGCLLGNVIFLKHWSPTHISTACLSLEGQIKILRDIIAS